MSERTFSIHGSVNYRLPSVEFSAALATEEDGSQMLGELYRIQGDNTVK